jgi:hypothetical protein
MKKINFCKECKKCGSIEFHRINGNTKKYVFRYVVVSNGTDIVMRRTIIYGDYKYKNENENIFSNFTSCVYYLKSGRIYNYDPFFHAKSLYKLSEKEKSIIRGMAKEIIKKIDFCPYKFEMEISGDN